MIVEQLVPEIYYKDSRDFAFIGRLLEIIFNYMKTASDNAGVEPNENIDSNIISLLVNTLGFEARHSYQNRDLVYIASSFMEIIRNKGSEKSIQLAIQTLLNSQKIKTPLVENLYYYDQENKELTVYLPVEMTDSILLDDLMDYILPAGVLYKIVRVSGYIGDDTAKTAVKLHENIQILNNKFTTRIHNIYNVDSESKYNDDGDHHLGTIYTGTTIDEVIGTQSETSTENGN